jgi:hypothetical protein
MMMKIEEVIVLFIPLKLIEKNILEKSEYLLLVEKSLKYEILANYYITQKIQKSLSILKAIVINEHESYLL